MKIKTQISLAINMRRVMTLDEKVDSGGIYHEFGNDKRLISKHEWAVVDRKFDPVKKK